MKSYRESGSRVQKKKVFDRKIPIILFFFFFDFFRLG